MICLRLLLHLTRLAAARTFCTAGSKRPIRMPMMAITTSSSIRVKARRVFGIVRSSGGIVGAREKSRFRRPHPALEGLAEHLVPLRLLLRGQDGEHLGRRDAAALRFF